MNRNESNRISLRSMNFCVQKLLGLASLQTSRRVSQKVFAFHQMLAAEQHLSNRFANFFGGPRVLFEQHLGFGKPENLLS